MSNTISLEINKRTLSIDIGKIAKQADGSALLRYGDTMMLVTATSRKELKEGKDFLPLIVDYRENTYAAGKIPGGFFKREGRPSEREILIARLIDRPIRPLFPEGYFFDTQIVGLLLSADLENEPDTLGVIGASAALYFSDIPFTTPLGAVKVGLVDGQYVVNPTDGELDRSPINITVVSNERRHHHDRGRGQGDRGGQDPRRAGPRPRDEPADHQGPEGPLRPARHQEARVHAQARGRGEAGPGRARARARPPRGHAGPRQEGQRGRPARRPRSRPGRDPRGQARREARGERPLLQARGEALPRARPQEEAPHRRARLRRHPPDHERGRPPDPDPRFGPVHPRRDPGPGHGHPGHLRGRPAARQPRRGIQETVHAPLQLPAVLGRRGGLPAGPRAPRDRARRPGRKIDPPGHSRHGHLPLHHPHRLGHPGEQRLLLAWPPSAAASWP